MTDTFLISLSLVPFQPIPANCTFPVLASIGTGRGGQTHPMRRIICKESGTKDQLLTVGNRVGK